MEVHINEKGERTIYIEGLGSITEVGKLDVEGLVRMLLQDTYLSEL